MRRGIAIVMSSVLALPVLQVPLFAEAASAQAVAASGSAADAVESAALAEAKQTGEPVEVPGRTTETSKLSALPDGQFQWESSPVPVRVQKNGVFQDADLTLERQPDGTLAPKASVNGVSFGGGGNDVLATMESDGKKLTLTWPEGNLRPPVLHGESATYVDAGGSGVDLVVKANAAGWSSYVVVKTPEAAQSPSLEKIDFGVDASGVELKSGADGSVAAVDTAGTEVFSAPQPQMWEGATPAAEAGSGSTRPEEVSAGPPPAADEKPMEVQVTADKLSLVPDQGLLKAADTKFPVVIDPTWMTWNGEREPDGDGGTQGAGWAYVDRTWPNESYWKPDRLPTGREDEDYTDKRSYIRMNSTTIHKGSAGRKAKIHDVTLTFDAQHAWSCVARDVRLYNVGGISHTTTWNSRPDWYIPGAADWDTSWLATASVKVGRPECGDSGTANDVKFDSGNLIRLMQYATDHEWDYVTIGLYPDPDYSDAHTWKVMDEDPRMVVKFSRYPDAPSGTHLLNGGTSKYPCVQGPNRPWVGTSRNRQLLTKIKDIDGDGRGFDGQKLRAQYELAPLNNAAAASVQYSPASGYAVASASDGMYHAVTTSLKGDTAPATADGGTSWQWRVRGQDDTALFGAWSPWCEYTVDGVPPNKPGVSATVYAEGQWSGYDPATRTYLPGTFSFTPADSKDVVKYDYRFSDGTAGTVPVTAGGSGVAPSWRPKKFGAHWFEVTSYDRAGNPSETRKVQFGVEQPPRDAAWSMDETEGTSAAAVGNSGQARPGANLVLSAGPARGRQGNLGAAVASDRSVMFNGTDQYGEVAPVLEAGGSSVPLVDTSKRFMFSTWVKLNSTTGDQVALSQTAADGTVFELGWIGGRWSFRHRNADGSQRALVTRDMAAAGDGTPWTGHWVSLMAGYDQISNQIWLRTQAEGKAKKPVCTKPWICTYPRVMAPQTESAADAWTPAAGTGSLLFGATTTGTGRGAFFNGFIDDSQLWPLAHPDESVLKVIYGESVQDQEFAGNTVRLVNVGSGHCLDVAAAGRESMDNIQQWQCNAGKAQNWQFTDLGNDLYTLTNPHSGMCLDVDTVVGEVTADGRNVWQYECDGGQSQQWKPEKQAGGYWLRNLHTGKCLAVDAGSGTAGANALQWACDTAPANAVLWNITSQKRHELNGVTYRLYGAGSDKCLEVAAGGTGDDADVMQWACNGGTWQDWKFTHLGDGYYSLTNINSAKCLDVAGSSTAPGTAVQQRSCEPEAAGQSFNANQSFKMVPVGDDARDGYRLIAQHSDLLLSVKGASTSDGGDITQENPVEPARSDQVWKLGCLPGQEWRCRDD